MFRGSPDGELEGAETNKRWKQVIPYFTLVRNGMILTYKKNKSSSEIRLHDKYSIGIGGHVNDRDGTGMSAVRTAAIRECKEEIGVIPKLSGNKDDYVVIDIKGEAADYHIGYCQIITEWQPEGIKLSEEVDKISWKTIAELEKLDLEEWSLFVLELLKKDFIFESEVR
jgi:predicted NUDIX family phosphoesterase